MKSLLGEARTSNPPLCPEEIGIMAPWRLQVRKLRKKLRDEGLHAVDVGTVEVGHFYDFICVSFLLLHHPYKRCL